MKVPTTLGSGAKLVIGRPLFRILQHRVGFANILEALLGIRFLTDIRVVLAGEFAIRLLDLILGRVAGQPHDGVVVLELHTSPTRQRPTSRARTYDELKYSTPSVKCCSCSFAGPSPELPPLGAAPFTLRISG